MKFRYLFLLIVFGFDTAFADFSNTQVWIHPLYIANNEPFIVDIRGEWPTDCHPGEQKPVITEYTGDTALIEFETIVEHVTCNEVATPYRVLVDMSDVIGSLDGEFEVIDITIRFDGAEKVRQVTTFCGLWCDPPPPPRNIKPEAGLYYSDGLEKQGLLLARQNQRMGVYPLVYDESGSSEWLFGAGGIVENVYFTDLYELTGGQCLGCLPPAEPIEMRKVGKLSMLMDSEGLIQVKVNDGLFRIYQQSEFGYGGFEIVNPDDDSLVRIPNLSGRWAFSDTESVWGAVTSPPTSILPLVFDVTLKVSPTITLIPTELVPPSKDVWYSILDLDGESVAELICSYNEEMICDLKSLTNTELDDVYEVKLLSIERMIVKNTAPNDPRDGVGDGVGTAVRVD